MHDAYHAFHLNLLKLAYNNLSRHTPFDDPNDHTSAELMAQWQQLIAHFSDQVDLSLGQQLLERIAITYPDLMPLVPRDLFWFFGGSCLHFMPDEEISLYQQLDELRYEAEASGNTEFNYEVVRARILGLH
ncbi:PA2817 family protein [Pontibacter sp. JAM-7]|uniref:PA2817 family protein n=1 Tax=Pontibacter sp. JAM-7 TaxID=3366581 RepID=UPI003AF68098